MTMRIAKRSSMRLALLALLVLPFLAASAIAQPAKIFLASTGSDSNDGSRFSPKRSLQAAHDAVASGGSLVILDTAGYGPLTITKSVDVTVPPGVNGFSTNPNGGTAIFIDAGATANVSLRGLIVEGTGTLDDGGTGIRVRDVGSLTLDDCKIRNFTTGVGMIPVSSANLVMRGGSIIDTVDGLYVQANTAFIKVAADINGVLVDHATYFGLRAASFANATVTMTIRRCTVTGSNEAILTDGAVTIIVDGCTLAGNQYAFFKKDSSGTIVSRGNNTLVNNVAKINSPNTVVVQAGE